MILNKENMRMYKKWTLLQATSTGHLGKLVIGEKFEYIKGYFFNGEGWSKVKRIRDGALLDIPDVFLDEVK